MDILFEMTGEDLLTIGITQFGVRHRIMKKIRELVQGPSSGKKNREYRERWGGGRERERERGREGEREGAKLHRQWSPVLHVHHVNAHVQSVRYRYVTCITYIACTCALHYMYMYNGCIDFAAYPLHTLLLSTILPLL